ncbi:flavoprotein [Paenarthrobacter nicotinovorans]|nr:flavoprotein [Paenarthrobacter nicotinovorans]
MAAALAGDQAAADTVHLELPETGVCSAEAGTSCEVPDAATTQEPEAQGGCCTAPKPAFVGFPTGLVHGRSAGN